MYEGHAIMSYMGFWYWLLIVAVISLAIWALSSRRHQNSGGKSSNSAKEILRRRLASGEIDTEEYRKLLAELRG